MSDIHISSAFPISKQGLQEIRKEIAEERAMQIESSEDLQQYFEVATFNPLEQAQKFRNLKELHASRQRPAQESEEVEEKILDVESIDETAERFHKMNSELNPKTLRILRSRLSNSDTSSDILQKVDSVYKEAALADEAIEFLYETTEAELQAATAEAKERLRKEKGKEIRAGRNMGAQAREFSTKGLGSPESLRELYRSIISDPREPLKLFDELAEKFRYANLKMAIQFMLHSLGSDLKAKGPSISRGELKRLLDETRSMQGILGVFRFFQSRMRLIQREFASYDLLVPDKLDFEMLARIFVKLLAERFMSPDKIVHTAKIMGIVEEVAAQIVIFSQMRDAIKQIAPKYFRNPRHKEEVFKAFIDTIEKLEDLLEEEEEKEK
ncbi:MAG: hypothetical protein ACD_17C00153G0002 [uncultured bacterium]|nr:MAG: hypothetical protein ACD_17C00153G0002 [uncultured bacterium]OGN56950.1 MAG: hypothetical protein A2796_06485 [Chlamydiae bacterium RIFCSPHIGHO2_01_FULL_44_39]OGN59643.1 MAG: hypothetical protein A3D96_06360 [Chlamydiae bacterium RIFCSPHIGHO2_12_FULL_44_59]OGN65733.1 MAG: hypothetical protein A2978_07355 [Chlamydiae bacterium RIFCSPLOWO2_01_FULL_44_52]OGN67875.1 MAG: hypothetical protein A3I67_05835 [Chlamydiae bacterium RIFCSPLOWO2_02_FULL_45_22]OGN69366.1 MAG: hypothetical protein A3